jgi:hypothetical protein
MLRNFHNLRGMSYLESLIAIAFVTLLLFAIGRLVDPEAEPTTDGPDFREALSLAQAELEVLATLAPEEVARQVPVGERITVIGGSLLPERDRRGAISIDGRRVPWRPTCDGLKPAPGDACPGIYRRIERLDGATSPEGAYHVTVVVAWPDPENPNADPLRRVDLQARVG